MTTRTFKVGKAGNGNVTEIEIPCGGMTTFGEAIAMADIAHSGKLMTVKKEVTSTDVIPEDINRVLIAAPKIDGGADCDRTFKVGKAGNGNVTEIEIAAGEILTFGEAIARANMEHTGKLMTVKKEVTSTDVIPDDINRVLIAAPKIDGGICN